MKVHNKSYLKLYLRMLVILASKICIQVVFHDICFQNVTFQCCRMGKKISVYFCLINNFSCDPYYFFVEIYQFPVTFE